MISQGHKGAAVFFFLSRYTTTEGVRDECIMATIIEVVVAVQLYGLGTQHSLLSYFRELSLVVPACCCGVSLKDL